MEDDKEVIEPNEEETIEPNEETVEKNEETIEPNEEVIEPNEEETLEGSEEIAEEPEKPVSRAQKRIQTLSSDLKTERDEREKLVAEHATSKARLEFLQQQQQDNQRHAETRAEEERLALLDPDQREIYQANKRAQNIEQRLQQMEMQQQDALDRTEFHAKALHDETYGKYAKQVEDMYQEGLRRGVVAPREDLHSLILGQELKKNAQVNMPAKKAAAKKRVESATSRSVGAKSDVSGGSKRGKTAEERLEGVQI